MADFEKNLKVLLSSMEQDHLTKSDFINEFKKVLDFVSKLKEINSQALYELNSYNSENTKKLKSDVQDIKNLSEEKYSKLVNNFNKKLDELTNIINLKMQEVKDGKDADEERIVGIVLSKIEFPEPKEVEDDIPEELRNKLEMLEGDNRLNVSAIKGLDELITLKTPKILGGFNYGSIDIHSIDSEIPTGLVNGSNTNFELVHAPNPSTSLKVYVNGQRMKLTEDYTISGTTITFNIAPPTSSILLVDYRV